MKSMNLMIVRLLLFFYLSSSYLSATHIHNDALEGHSDCKVCIVVKNLHSKDILDADVLSLNCTNCYELVEFNQQIITLVLYKGFNANAPPLDS